MNELQLFNFQGSEVRTVLIDEIPYFVGKDIADILGYSRSSKAINDHVDKTDQIEKIVNISQSSQNGTQSEIVQNVKLVNESGVYELIFNSKLPKAKKFKRWVTSDVLPTIRKHGAYLTDEKIEEVLLNPDTIIQLATQLKEEKTGRLIAEQQVKELQPKVTYYDQVLANKSLVTVTQISKDYGLSGQALNALLHKLGVQYKQGKTWLLYAKHQAKGWTQSETIMVDKTDGTQKAVLNTKWTQKGRLGLYELLKTNGYLPLIEQES